MPTLGESRGPPGFMCRTLQAKQGQGDKAASTSPPDGAQCGEIWDQPYLFGVPKTPASLPSCSKGKPHVAHRGVGSPSM